jgi:hypothetical protein
MSAEQLDQMISKIDEVIGPPESESHEDRRRRLRATARHRELRRAAAAQSTSTGELRDVPAPQRDRIAERSDRRAHPDP